MRQRITFWLLWIISTAAAANAADSPRTPVPDEESQKTALAQIQSIYKSDYEKSKSASQRLEMAHKMLKEADGTTDDVVAKFVLLRVARDIAAQQGDLSTAFESIDRISEAYEADSVPMKIDAAKTAVKAMKSSADHQRSLDQLQTMIDGLLETEKYDAAKSLGPSLLANARGTRDATTVKVISGKLKEIDEIAVRFLKVEEYAAILISNATDPTANLELGKFRCFVRGDWDRGIPMLALGNDEALRKLAELELADEIDYLAAGDAWWDYGENQSSVARKQAQSHAAQLYLKTISQQLGVTKKRLEQRLAIASSRYPAVISNSIGMQFKLISPGHFVMGGGPEGASENSYNVTISKPYYLGIFEVTQQQYAALMGTNPSSHRGANNPVDKVSWNEAVEFCRRLSSLPKERAAGRVYRLPTEAEWEYACRAGTTTAYSYGDDPRQLSEFGWHEANSGGTTHPVGQLKPNLWGLYDMHGNVYEWCHDWTGAFPAGTVTDRVRPPMPFLTTLIGWRDCDFESPTDRRRYGASRR